MARALVCLRYFLVGGVIVLGISGVVQSIFAGYFIYQLYEYAPLTPNDVCSSSATLLGMGVITCLISWCSWHFLNFTNRSQVVIFAVCLAIISAVQTGAGVWALVRHEQVDALPVAHLEKVFALAVTDDKHVWDHMQSRLHCCGVSGPASYRKEDAIPWSCCDTSSLANSNDTKGVCTSIYARGCHHVVINRTRSVLLHVFLLALCSVLLQVCFILCTTCYTKACKERLKKRRILMLASQPTTPQPRELEGHPLAPSLSRYSKPPNEAQL
ncbi:hypothetical protein KM043_014750 [Ampulex compressa]|nr:hypothetical protein KM043_014750 [Ampulex compressa]